MTTMVRIDEVTKHFDDVVAVDGISLMVEPGEVVGLLGANGAGKTTLIKLLLGLLPPTHGEVKLMGGRPGRETRRHIGYMPQTLGLYEDLTVAQNLAFTADAFGAERPQLDDDLAAVSRSPISELPLGLRRRTAFVAALCHAPRLLVLDEPTSGVGPLGRSDLWDTIHDTADQGAAALVTTHYMDEAEQCDRLVIMASGKEVAAGSVDDIVTGHRTVEVKVDDTARALRAFEEHGYHPLPRGSQLRVPGISPATLTTLLGEIQVDEVESTPSTLEEVFITLSSDSSP